MNRTGMLMEATQDTPTTNKREPNYVLFGNMVHLQTPINHIGADAAIILEFKHYKVGE